MTVMTDMAAVLFNSQTAAQLATSLDCLLVGVRTMVCLDVATTPTESRRIAFYPDPGMTVQATRASNVLTIKFKTAAGDYEPFTGGASNDLNLIFSVTDASAVTLVLRQTGKKST